jgi:PEGA domain
MKFDLGLARRTVPALICPPICGTLLVAILLSSTAAAQSVVESGTTTAVMSAVTTTAKSAAVTPPASATLAVSAHLPAPSGPPPEEANRRTLEERAGRDASKLLVRSTLADSRIWIDGKPVGNAPMLLVVPPGRYHIEIVGPHAERTQSAVALLPRETLELTLKLQSRYPNRVTMH